MAKESEIPLAVLLRYFRVPTGELPVDYPGRELLLGSSITNISVSGVFVSTQRPLPQGTELDIVFQMPGSGTEVRAKTIVRWTKAPAAGRRAQAGDMCGMGLEFLKIGKREQKVIEKFVKEFLTRMRRGG